MVRGAWRAIVHGMAKSQTQLSMHTNPYTHTHTHTRTHTHTHKHRVKGAGRLAGFEIHEILALLVAQSVKNLPAVQETGFDPWVAKIPWRGNGNPLQYSCLENPMDRGAWWPTVHGMAKSQTQLSD